MLVKGTFTSRLGSTDEQQILRVMVLMNVCVVAMTASFLLDVAVRLLKLF